MTSTALLRGWVLGCALLSATALADMEKTAAQPMVLKPTKWLTVAQEQALIDSVPAVPAPGSPQDQADLAEVLKQQADREKNPGLAAEAKLDQHFSVELFLPIFGQPVTKEHDPKFYQFIKDLNDTTRVINSTAKDKYKRPRPYVGHPEVVKGLFPVQDFSYPSGHAMAAYANAVVLGALLPDKQQAFLVRAALIAQSRVDAGVHYPSDIQEGEKLGRATAAALLAEKSFQDDLAAVKAELTH